MARGVRVGGPAVIPPPWATALWCNRLLLSMRARASDGASEPMRGARRSSPTNRGVATRRSVALPRQVAWGIKGQHGVPAAVYVYWHVSFHGRGALTPSPPPAPPPLTPSGSGTRLLRGPVACDSPPRHWCARLLTNGKGASLRSREPLLPAAAAAPAAAPPAAPPAAPARQLPPPAAAAGPGLRGPLGAAAAVLDPGGGWWHGARLGERRRPRHRGGRGGGGRRHRVHRAGGGQLPGE